MQMQPAARQEASRIMLKTVCERLRWQVHRLPTDLVEEYSVVPIMAQRKKRPRK
jgi:hypothetical protein